MRAIGQKHPAAKLTDDQAREIAAQPKVQGSVLAKRYGVSPVAIHYLRTGVNWSTVTGIPKREQPL
ncbi:MAG: hypothetical protein ACYDD1_05435 [Caulobacteraceae bacterium]